MIFQRIDLSPNDIKIRYQVWLFLRLVEWETVISAIKWVEFFVTMCLTFPLLKWTTSSRRNLFILSLFPRFCHQDENLWFIFLNFQLGELGEGNLWFGIKTKLNFFVVSKYCKYVFYLCVYKRYCIST